MGRDPAKAAALAGSNIAMPFAIDARYDEHGQEG